MIPDLKHMLGSGVGLTIAAIVVVGLCAWAMTSAAGRFMIRAEVMTRPTEVGRRAMELQRQMAERRINRIGEETRAAIQATAERRRRAGLVRDQPDR